MSYFRCLDGAPSSVTPTRHLMSMPFWRVCQESEKNDHSQSGVIRDGQALTWVRREAGGLLSDRPVKTLRLTVRGGNYRNFFSIRKPHLYQKTPYEIVCS